MPTRRIALISTGGTIEKTYDELEGVLHNEVSTLDVLLASLVLRGVEVVRVPLMNKDSLEMTERDHELIADTAHTMARAHDGVIIVHGTDRLSVTGDCIVAKGVPDNAIILTGAMRPYELRHTDAVQNMTEALLAVQCLSAGVYAVMHNQILKFPGVVKDRERGCFVAVDS